jgi:ribose 5-phosphate isomerase B
VIKGIAITDSGIGASIEANKVNETRAALVHDNISAHLGVEQDGMNLLCLGGSIIGIEKAVELATTFVKAEFNREKHQFQKSIAIETPNPIYF